MYRQVRLPEQRVLDLVAQYVAGATVPELVQMFEVNRTTVIQHLQRHGVPRRPHQRKMTEAKVTEAIQMYADGWSYLRLGTYFGVDDETVRKELLRAGVTSRPRGR